MKLVYVFFISFLGTGTAEELSGVDSWQKVDDMILSPLQSPFLYNPAQIGKNALNYWSLRWKDGILPYEVTSEFDANDKKLIEKVLKEEFAKTCVSFRPRTKEKVYVRVVNRKGCWSEVGRGLNMQELSLDKSLCLNRRSIAHQFLHALGLFHQHSAGNRDDYVIVNWDNIKPGRELSFQIFKWDITDLGEPYDYNSIMHYPEKAYSVNGKPTLVAKKSNVRFGHATSLSAIDINKVNKMYNCTVK